MYITSVKTDETVTHTTHFAGRVNVEITCIHKTQAYKRQPDIDSYCKMVTQSDHHSSVCAKQAAVKIKAGKHSETLLFTRLNRVILFVLIL